MERSGEKGEKGEGEGNGGERRREESLITLSMPAACLLPGNPFGTSLK
jgi:hypothetical protein